MIAALEARMQVDKEVASVQVDVPVVVRPVPTVVSVGLAARKQKRAQPWLPAIQEKKNVTPRGQQLDKPPRDTGLAKILLGNGVKIEKLHMEDPTLEATSADLTELGKSYDPFAGPAKPIETAPSDEEMAPTVKEEVEVKIEIDLPPDTGMDEVKVEPSETGVDTDMQDNAVSESASQGSKRSSPVAGCEGDAKRNKEETDSEELDSPSAVAPSGSESEEWVDVECLLPTGYVLPTGSDATDDTASATSNSSTEGMGYMT